MSAAPLAQISVGVVVERRKAASPWIDFTWRPVTALPGAPVAAPWTQLSADGDVATFYAGATAMSRSTAPTLRTIATISHPDRRRYGWRCVRPASSRPSISLRSLPIPAEGEGFTQNGDHLVEAVPMPEAVRAVVEAFVAEHHVEQPFVKRKRDRADPGSAGAARRRWPKDRTR